MATGRAAGLPDQQLLYHNLRVAFALFMYNRLMKRKLNVLFIAAEADPFIKVGGLGDVAGSLPRALRHVSPGAELDVRLVIPFHSAIRSENLDLKREAVFSIPREGGDVPAQVFRVDMDNVPVYLIAGEPINAYSEVYTSDTRADGFKYTFFSLAALELARVLNWRPDILHANDWHTAPAVYALRLRRDQDDFFKNTRAVLGIHNLVYTGKSASDALRAHGLPPVLDGSLPDWAEHVPLALGLWAADSLAAVSPTYAQEILTPEFGAGLDAYLRTRRNVITGIVNGIDETMWDPSTDSALDATFTAETLDRRAANKTALQTRCNFAPHPDVPLLAMVTRMDPQKGVDIALDALRLLPDDLPWQAVILGTGVHFVEEAARRLEADLPDRVCAIIRYDGKLSRQIYAGADLLLMPSRYEPCGLAQMIAMRYGCLPLVRATGGLRDTVQDGQTGFVFAGHSPEAMSESLRRAIQAFGGAPAWRQMQQAGMAQDFSWDKSAREYLKLYQSLLA